ncbi:hypothetical protein G8A07_03380 [Roseateles sp. DAIF2]|uniref:hypothetical protein n=1 Tax=Roseateles sp. DAIF2 TaxID=2714952 RepID=UPI0018A2C7A2|nr:hypothetical protein [Roseateles sp. DAIF2]QPF72068.1 hypothetical protein G8A07_03380 [Roseateles sp. DAIF2]
MRALMLCLAAAALLAGCARPPVAPDRSAEAPPQTRACPAGLPADTRCLGGRDSAGAFYLIAIPAGWQGELVLHSHGGPFLGAPNLRRVEEDLQRWSIMPRAGYAWAGSSYRQGGVAVRAAAEDTERLRRLFVAHVGRPTLTILHGQSWGASVAAKGAEMFAENKPYDGVLLSSGVLAGGTRAYDMRLDLRVIYQYLCGNHPRADEPQYPLWQGLPVGSTMTRSELARRVNDCLALNKPAAERSAEQARRVKTLVDVLHIPPRSIQSHLNWATFHFQDIAERRSGGANVFGNIGARYIGSDDDAALNAGVLRYAADPAAVARFGADADPDGQIPVPVLTVHGIHDPAAFVEMQHSFGQTMARAGRADALVQTYTDDSEHSYLSDATYVALLQALKAWLREGRKPTPAAVAEACAAAQQAFPSHCRFRPDYRPAALDTRVAPRQRP